VHASGRAYILDVPAEEGAGASHVLEPRRWTLDVPVGGALTLDVRVGIGVVAVVGLGLGG
jgi:hypothetical protein